MPTEFDLLVLGDANPDLIIRGEATPVFGQVETIVDDATLVLGGSGAIMASGASKLGLRVAFAGVVGNDMFGGFVRASLDEQGVDTRAIRVADDRSTGLSVILARTGDRAILTAKGTIADLRGDEIDRDLVRSTRHVHVSSYFLQQALWPDLPKLFDDAHAAGATCSIDPNWDPSGKWDSGLPALLDRTDVFLPNSVEARAISGIDDVEDAAQAINRHGTISVVKLGGAGGLAVDGGEIARCSSHLAEVADTIGAGDNFDAGFVAGRLKAWPLARCLQLAIACGSLSTRKVGGSAGQPTLDEALAAMESAT